MGPGECVLNENQNRIGLQYNCFGELHFADPSAPMPHDHYEMLGRVAGFLVEQHGLAAVLDVCATVGWQANGDQLAEAMQAILGTGPDEVLAALSESPRWCDNFDRYRSRVFACGVQPDAPSLGVVDHDIEVSIDVGCEQADTVSTAVGDEIQRVFSIDIPIDGVYFIEFEDEATGMPPSPGGVFFSQCTPCGDWADGTAEAFKSGNLPLVASLSADRYMVEVRLPSTYSGALRLTVRPP